MSADKPTKTEMYVPPKRKEASMHYTSIVAPVVQASSASPVSASSASKQRKQRQQQRRKLEEGVAPIGSGSAERMLHNVTAEDTTPAKPASHVETKVKFVPRYAGSRPVSASNVTPPKQQQKHQRQKPRNTESFEPSFEKPDMRVVYGSPNHDTYPRPVGVHDLIVVPDLFCAENDLDVYSNLLKELEAANCDSLFVSWHGDSHVIADDKKMGGKWKKLSPTFQKVIDRMSTYFKMDIKATRFNWYRDSSDWKPWHHDRAAFTPDCPQNITVAASFGAERDISFRHATQSTTIRLPQLNGGCYAFCKDANVEWKHGVMAEPDRKQHKRGRISIIAWGWVDMFNWDEEPAIVK